MSVATDSERREARMFFLQSKWFLAPAGAPQDHSSAADDAVLGPEEIETLLHLPIFESCQGGPNGKAGFVDLGGGPRFISTGEVDACLLSRDFVQVLPISMHWAGNKIDVL